MGGLFIEQTVAIVVFMGGPVSGAAMNPARHLGPAHLGAGMTDTWLCWVGPVLAAVLAAQVYRHVLEEKGRSA